MPGSLRSARPFGALFRDLRDPGGNRAALQHAAQLALQVEFATIPVYLQGMYSITDKSSVAYQTLRSVVMEEMFHVNQAANLVVGLGALPRFTGQAAPVYPGYLPHANENTTPQIGLYRASPQVFENVYAAIETPAPIGAPPQPDHYDTIAQLYEALGQAIDAFPGNPFGHPAPEGLQRTDIYLGKFGGEVIKVIDKATAHEGILQIVQQGEGTLPPTGSPLVPVEQFGAYNHYGQRTDGTYGPIIGTPLEMSHFIKFRQVAVSTDPFPQTLPITSNPDASTFTNPGAVQLTQAFNTAYSVMLKAFELTFHRAAGDPYFGVVLNLMHKVLPQLAMSLMQTPAHSGGDAAVGPNAAPTWTYLPEARLHNLDPQLSKLLQVEALPDAVRPALQEVVNGLPNLSTASTQLAL